MSQCWEALWLQDLLRYNLMSSYSDQWLKSINRHSDKKLRNVWIYKEIFAPEPYILECPVHLNRNIAKLRISICTFSGSWNWSNIQDQKQYMPFHSNNETKDETHIFLSCPFYNDGRSHLLISLSKLSAVKCDPNFFYFQNFSKWL